MRVTEKMMRAAEAAYEYRNPDVGPPCAHYDALLCAVQVAVKMATDEDASPYCDTCGGSDNEDCADCRLARPTYWEASP